MQGPTERPLHFCSAVIRTFLAVALGISTTAIQSHAAEGITFQVPFLVDGQVKTRVFNTVTGPEDGQRLLTGIRLVPSGQDDVFVGIDWHTVLRVTGDNVWNGESAPGLELNDWPMGIAYDSLANRAVLVTLGGEGALYQRNSNGEWSLLASMENEDLESLVYLRADNSFYGIRVYHGASAVPATLAHYSADGERLADISLPPFAVDLSPGGHQAELVAAEGKIIALVEQDPKLAMQPGNRSRIYVINPDTGSAELTYDEAPESSPAVQFNSPANNTTISLGDTIHIVVEASDLDNDLRMVTLFEGGTTLQTWPFDPGSEGAKTLTYEWTSTLVGRRTLYARAKDSRGNETEAIVHVTVNDTHLSFAGWYFKDDGVIGVDYRDTGPLDGGTLYRGLPVAQAGYRYLGRDGHTVFRWDNEHDQYTETSPGGDFSWPRGTTWDHRRNRFLVVTLGGEGELYAVNPITLEWSLVASMENVDVDSIVYHHVDDHLYMVENHGGTARILRYNSEGEPVGENIAIANVPLDIGSYYQTRLISAGAKIALLIEPTPGWRPNPPVESRIYIIDPRDKSAHLTYRKVWDQWPPEAPEPTLAIISPANGAQFVLGEPITITAQATGLGFPSVDFLAGGRKLSTVPIPPLALNNPTYSFTWADAKVGEHTLLAIGEGPGRRRTAPPIRIRVVPPAVSIVVERDLPDSYVPGQWVNVKLDVTSNSGVGAWAVEETAPPGWVMGQASHEGTYDSAAGRIKWGPFTDSQPRTLLYNLKAPAADTGVKTFSGIVSVNGVSKPIVGDTVISDAFPYHPADAPPQDYRLTVDEVTAYATAWKSGAEWPRPPSPIPVSYVTRAGLIWKSGETYKFNAKLRAPDCWIPDTLIDPPIFLAGVSATESQSEATRALAPAFSPGRATAVSIRVRPARGVQAYAVEERPPTGWTIASAENGSASNGSVRFGPFFDSQERTLVYHAVPSEGSPAGEFGGEVSFDGSGDAIKGRCALSPPKPVAEHRDGRVHLSLSATPGERFVLETADSVDSADWQYEATIEGADAPIELPAIQPSERQKFYRLRPVAP